MGGVGSRLALRRQTAQEGDDRPTFPDMLDPDGAAAATQSEISQTAQQYFAKIEVAKALMLRPSVPSVIE